MEPPWVQRPDIPRGSIGWRMGPGEDIDNAFWKWFSALDQHARDAYRRRHPEPADWNGYYALMESHPWFS